MEWSDMLPEVLGIIAHKHITFYEDYPFFAGVCKSWHSAAIQQASSYYSNGPSSRLPSLMLAEKSEDDEFRELFLLLNKSIRKIRLPQINGKVCMSSCGWLATVGDDYVAQLINPFSCETINLPKVDTFPKFVKTSKWYFGIRKLLLLHNNKSSCSLALPLVVILWGCIEKLGFCRPGDSKWTPVQGGVHSRIYDITYFNGRVYTFDSMSYIRACDIYGENPTELVEVASLPVDVYNKYAGNNHFPQAYILGLDDDERKRLLVVIRKIKETLCGKTYKTWCFQIFEYDLETRKWSEVKDLGNKTLFVGYNSSFWIEDTTSVIKGNCIYFTDDVLVWYLETKNGGGRDMGIYHLADGTIESHFTRESRSHLTPPIWLQSM
nr:hypothetical protein [Tanacetum cinerariifolium]